MTVTQILKRAMKSGWRCEIRVGDVICSAIFFKKFVDRRRISTSPIYTQAIRKAAERAGIIDHKYKSVDSRPHDWDSMSASEKRDW